MSKDNNQPGPVETPPQSPPQTVYETVEMTGDEIRTQNAAYAAMGLSCVIVDVSRFNAKLERQADGTYKRTTIRKAKGPKNETGTDSE